MNNEFTPDELFKKGLTQTDFEYDEVMWEKIQSKLEANRKEKKDKKRWLVLLFMFLLTGGAAYFVIDNQRNEKQNITAADNDTNNKAGNDKLSETKKSSPAGESNNNLKEITGVKPIESPNVKQAAADKIITPETKSAGSFDFYKSLSEIRKQNKKTDFKKQVFKNNIENKIAITSDENKAEVKSSNQQDATPINSLPEKNIAPAIDNNKTEMKQEAAPVKEEAISTTITKNENQKSINKNRLYVSSGGDISMPFNKVGFQAGVIWVKAANDNKHLFAGLSIVNHKLKQQYISASKINTPSPETDAVIDRMTALRFSFGYLFDLNAKRNRDNTFLSLGFEPSYAINLRTIYYDRNGQPSGPATLIVNSPIMDRAVNRFNLFFTAGIQKEFKNRLGVSLKAGYGFIPITNKEFYNRTTGNNNIRSLQAGFIYRLK
jgi:hypothetical protein